MPAPYKLFLDSDFIQLCRNSETGEEGIGQLRTSDPNLSSELKALVIGLGEGDIHAEVVLPKSQILYFEIDASHHEETPPIDDIRKALDGRTPYQVDEIVFDWDRAAGTIKVAAVAVETFDEAEAFARAHGIIAQSFSARPETGAFDRNPVFLHPDRALETVTETSDGTPAVDAEGEASPPAAIAVFSSVRQTSAADKLTSEPLETDGDQEPVSERRSTLAEDAGRNAQKEHPQAAANSLSLATPAQAAAEDKSQPSENVAPAQSSSDIAAAFTGVEDTAASPLTARDHDNGKQDRKLWPMAAALAAILIAAVGTLIATFAREEGPLMIGLDPAREVPEVSAPQGIASIPGPLPLLDPGLVEPSHHRRPRRSP